MCKPSMRCFEGTFSEVRALAHFPLCWGAKSNDDLRCFIEDIGFGMRNFAQKILNAGENIVIKKSVDHFVFKKPTILSHPDTHVGHIE